MLQETYYPGHATTAKRVIERHLIREFGLKPREATYHGGNIIDELQVMGILQRVPEDVIRNALLTIDIRKLQAHKAQIFLEISFNIDFEALIFVSSIQIVSFLVMIASFVFSLPKTSE